MDIRLLTWLQILLIGVDSSMYSSPDPGIELNSIQNLNKDSYKQYSATQFDTKSNLVTYTLQAKTTFKRGEGTRKPPWQMDTSLLFFMSVIRISWNQTSTTPLDFSCINQGHTVRNHKISTEETMANQKKDKYRSHLYDDGERNTHWRFGAPPNFDVVDKLFEEGRTKIWPAGSVEEMVQNLVKTFEMEVFHKTNPEDYKSFDPKKLTMSLNGRKPMSLKEVGMIGGGYNFFLQTALPEDMRVYDPARETADTSHLAFLTTFPRGFALEVVEVYVGPPKIVYKFRHWGHMEGPFKGHAPTGEMVEFFGVAMFELDENKKFVRMEFFYDRGELLGGLTKGSAVESADGRDEAAAQPSTTSSSCPFLRNTG